MYHLIFRFVKNDFGIKYAVRQLVHSPGTASTAADISM